MSQIPYLSGVERSAFDAWVEEGWARYVPPLSFSEVRKGVQALVRLREDNDWSESQVRRAYEGQGKRAAAATYLAWVHYLAAHHACEMLDLPERGPFRRIWDLGCGSGATGAALARALPGQPSIVGLDRSGWALDEARETWGALGLSGRARRESLPDAFPNAGRGELIALGWMLGELESRERRRVFARGISALRRGALLVVLDDLVPRPPWWPELLEYFEGEAVSELPLRISIERPLRVKAMDKAARQDHQVLALRALVAGRAPRTEDAS